MVQQGTESHLQLRQHPPQVLHLRPRSRSARLRLLQRATQGRSLRVTCVQLAPVLS